MGHRLSDDRIDQITINTVHKNKWKLEIKTHIIYFKIRFKYIHISMILDNNLNFVRLKQKWNFFCFKGDLKSINYIIKVLLWFNFSRNV